MDIDVIIPAKACSTRIQNKNWRLFHDGLSLVEIALSKLLLAGVDRDRIYISCEDQAKAKPTCDLWQVKLLPRDSYYADNNTPVTEWIRSTCGQVSGDSDIAWVQVCDPLFDEHATVFDAWQANRSFCDSITVVHPTRQYLMDQDFNPIGWQFGHHHKISQQLPQMYLMPFTMSILKRSAIAATGYHIGTCPRFYVSKGHSIDIDTEQEYRVAQLLYSEINEASC